MISDEGRCIDDGRVRNESDNAVKGFLTCLSRPRPGAGIRRHLRRRRRFGTRMRSWPPPRGESNPRRVTAWAELKPTYRWDGGPLAGSGVLGAYPARYPVASSDMEGANGAVGLPRGDRLGLSCRWGAPLLLSASGRLTRWDRQEATALSSPVAPRRAGGVSWSWG